MKMKKWIALVLSLAMCVAPLPVSAMAENAPSEMSEPAAEQPTTTFDSEQETKSTDVEESIPLYTMEIPSDTSHMIATVCDEYDKSPMQIGEERVIRFRNPETMTDGMGKIWRFYNGEPCFELDYAEDGLHVRAVRGGSMQIWLLAEGCTYVSVVDLSVEGGEDPTEPTTDYDPTGHCEDPYYTTAPQDTFLYATAATTVYDPTAHCMDDFTDLSETETDPTEPTETTEFYDPTGHCIIETYTEFITETVTEEDSEIACFAPAVEYDNSPMKVGETRTIRFYNPMTHSGKGGSVSTTGTCLYAEYEKDNDYFTVTATSAGEAKISICAAGCAFFQHITLTVEENTETTEYYDPTGHCEELPALNQELGMLDEDDAVNSKDGVLVLRDAAYFGTHGEHNLTEKQLGNADVNKDGKVNAADATCVFIYSAKRGADESLPAFPQFMENYLAQMPPAAESQECRSWCRKVDYTYTDNNLVKIFTTYEDMKNYFGDNADPQFDEDFFAEHHLVLIAKEQPSGSIRLSVNAAKETDGKLSVSLSKYSPEIQTCDMALWHILAETSRDVTDAADVSVTMDSEFYGGESYRVQSAENEVLHLFRSVDELKQFAFSPTLKGQQISELSRYFDEAFFETHHLLLLEIEAPSGSIIFSVNDVTADGNGGYVLHVEKFVPTTGTDDMLDLYLFTGTGKEITSADQFSLKIEEQRANA
ncbi:MAG: dockerin type I repeat-containing protein [Oscillospiraceae bacterium]|nr:dockerin type I repeat-containing protein [Oscillospiraceae bacterium]